MSSGRQQPASPRPPATRVDPCPWTTSPCSATLLRTGQSTRGHPIHRYRRPPIGRSLSSGDFWTAPASSPWSDRQDAVSRAAGRHVASLRDLTSREAFAVAEKLVDKNRTSATGSRWDQRDEDTWIDKL